MAQRVMLDLGDNQELVEIVAHQDLQVYKGIRGIHSTLRLSRLGRGRKDSQE